MSAPEHTVATVGVSLHTLLVGRLGEPDSAYALTLTRTLLASVEPNNGWRSAHPGRPVSAALRRKVLDKAADLYL